MNGAVMLESPSTSAPLMKISRANLGSIGPKCTVRLGTITMPYSVTFSYATTWPVCGFQCGSEYVRLTMCSAMRSTQSTRIAATVRAYSRVVSTSSADITHCGLTLNSADPG